MNPLAGASPASSTPPHFGRRASIEDIKTLIQPLVTRHFAGQTVGERCAYIETRSPIPILGRVIDFFRGLWDGLRVLWQTKDPPCEPIFILETGLKDATGRLKRMQEKFLPKMPPEMVIQGVKTGDDQLLWRYQHGAPRPSAAAASAPIADAAPR